MGTALQDQLAQGGRRWTDRSGLAANALDGPIGVAPVARRHVLGHGGVPVIAAGAQMRGNALAPQENLDGPRRQPHLDFAAGEAVGHAVKMYKYGLDLTGGSLSWWVSDKRKVSVVTRP